MNFHPWYFVNNVPWNHFYAYGNPEKLFKVSQRDSCTTFKMFVTFEYLLKELGALQKAGVIEVTPKLEKSYHKLKILKHFPQQLCKEIATFFETNYLYRVRYLCQHFKMFFETNKI